ncbi:protein of unknown function [Cupriavidus taiwanensis]|nr:protein of unknown function [Cupriavidus taiwanensis]
MLTPSFALRQRAADATPRRPRGPPCLCPLIARNVGKARIDLAYPPFRPYMRKPPCMQGGQ